MPLKKYREKKAREREEYGDITPTRDKKARDIKAYQDKRERDIKAYQDKRERDIKAYRDKKTREGRLFPPHAYEEYRGKEARFFKAYRDKKAGEREAYPGPTGSLEAALREYRDAGKYRATDAPKNGSFGTPARQNFKGMKKGGKVNKKKSYSRGGKVRGAGKASQGVRPAKMVKMKGS